MSNLPTKTTATSKTWRSPAIGVVPPRGKAAVHVELALTDEDTPVLMTWPRNVALAYDIVSATQVVITNTMNYPVAFAMFFTNRKWVAAATFNWGALFDRLRQLRRAKR